MAPKKQPLKPVKAGLGPPKGGELDAKARAAFPDEPSYASIARSATPEKRERRQLVREAQKKGVKPEVLAAIGRGESAPPSPAPAKGGGRA
jgi:hypothetical protein